MSTHKWIDKICVGAIVSALVICFLFMNGEALGVQAADRVMGYESRLFDTEKVHTIDIVMDDWDGFITDCESEEYSACSVVIDGEAYKNVGIRAKGNTSLSSVSSMNSRRYSFKIEFDQYDSTKSYYGLDKLSLNNVIQDNTFMKDYLTYTMMNSFGVNAPLCSYVYITVNGEDWGLYLAVEGVEDGFLQRNYGNDYGELYKPDSLSFGGGRGNGKEFDINEFFGSDGEGGGFELPDGFDSSIFENGDFSIPNSENGTFPQMGGDMQLPDGADQSAGDSAQLPNGENGTFPQMGGNMQLPDGVDQSAGDSAQLPNSENGTFPQMGGDMQLPDGADQSAGDSAQLPNGENGTFPQMGGNMQLPDGVDQSAGDSAQLPNSENGTFPQMGGGMFGGGMTGSMGSDDVKLQYIDDDPDSYSNIFNNAKTDITDADKERLIESLKSLSENEDVEKVVDVEQVIRYFVVHNFVCNGDSYTGNMIHNYYLYEEDGQLSMIPWDYNLAFGTFQSSDASSTVNSPIDTPVSGGSDDRPMLNWIFESEEYTQLYHQYFAEFLAKVDFADIIGKTAQMIAPYVEKDPTKFCTYEGFEAGVEAISQFCMLRAESVSCQLDGTIPSTTEGQSADSSALVDASALNISDMGTMGGSMGGDNMMHNKRTAVVDTTEEYNTQQTPDGLPGEEFDPSAATGNSGFALGNIQGGDGQDNADVIQDDS